MGYDFVVDKPKQKPFPMHKFVPCNCCNQTGVVLRFPAVYPLPEDAVMRQERCERCDGEGWVRQ